MLGDIFERFFFPNLFLNLFDEETGQREMED